MRPSFRICIIVPPGYAHAACFTEVAFLLKASLTTLGYSCDLTLNDLSIDKINIILGAHLMRAGEHLRGYRYIPYQLEQLSLSEGAWNNNLRDLLKNAFTVWDYAPQNITFLAEQGLAAQLVLVGYHDALQQIVPAATQDVDLLFYGSLGPRRAKILETVAAKGFTVKHIFGVYGQDRDVWIARAKVVVNIHHYAAQIFEAVRVSYLINNGCCVVSEKSVHFPYEAVPLTLSSYEELSETCCTFIKDDALRSKNRASMQNAFMQKYQMTDILKPILEHIG